MMKTVSAVVAYEAIKKAANPKQELRIVGRADVGDVFRQGDIYLHRVADSHKRGAARGAQLAVGTSDGARHIAEQPAKAFEGIDKPTWCAAGTFLGPVVVSSAPFVVTHPEHAHIQLPAGTYQVTHQMDARTLDRVRD